MAMYWSIIGLAKSNPIGLYISIFQTMTLITWLTLSKPTYLSPVHPFSHLSVPPISSSLFDKEYFLILYNSSHLLLFPRQFPTTLLQPPFSLIPISSPLFLHPPSYSLPQSDPLHLPFSLTLHKWPSSLSLSLSYFSPHLCFPLLISLLSLIDHRLALLHHQPWVWGRRAGRRKIIESINTWQHSIVWKWKCRGRVKREEGLAKRVVERQMVRERIMNRGEINKYIYI